MQKEVDIKNLFQLKFMQRFCEDKITCRRRFQLLYFGQDFDKSECGEKCDNCRNKARFVTRNYINEFRKILQFFEAISNGELIVDNSMTM